MLIPQRTQRRDELTDNKIDKVISYVNGDITSNSDYSYYWKPHVETATNLTLTSTGGGGYIYCNYNLLRNAVATSLDASSNFKFYDFVLASKAVLNPEVTSESRKVTEISKLINKEWIVQKERRAGYGFKPNFYSPISASEFFEIGKDLDLESERLILDDEELTFNYYMSIIDEFLNNYVVLDSYPSTKIGEFEFRYLSSIPRDEYRGLNLLVYSKSKSQGIYYICNSIDLERTKKLLKEEVEKEESLNESPSPKISDKVTIGGTN